MSTGVPSRRPLRFLETVNLIVDAPSDGTEVRKLAALVVSARQFVASTANGLLACKTAEEMESLLERAEADTTLAVAMLTHVETMTVSGPSSSPKKSNRLSLLEQLKKRGAPQAVVQRVRLGLLAADDEVSLLQSLPGGLMSYPDLVSADLQGRFVLLTIAKWAWSADDMPAILDALTYKFLDLAGRAFGIASTKVADAQEDWRGRVA